MYVAIYIYIWELTENELLIRFINTILNSYKINVLLIPYGELGSCVFRYDY